MKDLPLLDINASRREIVAFFICASMPCIVSGRAFAQESDFDDLYHSIISSPGDIQSAKSYMEASAHQFVFEDGVSNSFSQPSRTKGRSNRTLVSEALKLIISSEVSSKKVYEAKYLHPVWPEGSSGITIALGYDIGQTNAADFESDWTGYLSDEDISLLKTAVGVRGEAAAKILNKYNSVEISWSTALKSFTYRSLPYFVAETEYAFQNTDALPDKCFGALVDMVYNRGSASYYNPSSKDSEYNSNPRLEIREIKKLMAAKDFKKIPEQLRLMTRLWKNKDNAKGVVVRRLAEAALFEDGLA